LESLIDKNTRGIILNNPSNPCGSVYSEQHLKDLAKIAEKHHLPIIADEIYGYMTFFGKEFHPMASISDKIPIITVSGLAKRYLVPGWRVGWICVYDKTKALDNIRIGINKMTTVILGANTLIQGAIPDILENEPKEFIGDLNKILERNSTLIMKQLSQVKGLEITQPYGAFYVMVKIDTSLFSDDIQDDVSFSAKLLKEESVMVLPGQCFNMKNFFRIVLCATEEKLCESFKRIEEFCQRNRK
jgi:tyrosine aminotransferase